MDAQIFTTLGTGAMLAMFTAILAWQGKGRMDSFERQLAEFRSEMREFRSEVRAELSDARSEIAVLRSDLTHVALAVGARPRPQTG